MPARATMSDIEVAVYPCSEKSSRAESRMACRETADRMLEDDSTRPGDGVPFATPAAVLATCPLYTGATR